MILLHDFQMLLPFLDDEEGLRHQPDFAYAYSNPDAIGGSAIYFGNIFVAVSELCFFVTS